MQFGNRLLGLILLLSFVACQAPLVRPRIHERHLDESEKVAFDKDGILLHVRQTRIRFPNFEVILHDFRGYERYNDGIYLNEYDTLGAIFNDDEREKSFDYPRKRYMETIIARQDSLFIGEQLFDDRINNTLIEIVPQDRRDRYRITMRYCSVLCEAFDYRNHTKLEARVFPERQIIISEKTRQIKLGDSARCFFRARPHTSDMEEITVRDGQIVPVKPRNSKSQIWEENRFGEQDLRRIKRRHAVHDTLVVIPGEYDITATLTKNKRLFTYEFTHFVFCITRSRFGMRPESKYILVTIVYGC